MDWITISFIVPMVLGVLTMIVYVFDAFRGPSRIQPLRLFQAGIIFYFLLIYFISLFGSGVDIYIIRSGIMTRIGVSLLFITLLVEGVVRRRKWARST